MFDYLGDEDKCPTLERFMRVFEDLTPPETPELPHQHQVQSSAKNIESYYFSFGKHELLCGDATDGKTP